jgi:transporter family protein
VRTLFVCAFVFAFALFAVPAGEVSTLTRANVLWLALSALTTAASWVFYYKALKDGDVSTVALIDKGSFVVAVVLAWLFLGEKLTPRVLLGGALIVCGVLVVAKK